MNSLTSIAVAVLALCCSGGVLPAEADPVPLTRGGLLVSFSSDGSAGVSGFRFVSNRWTIDSTDPIGGDATLSWDNFCTACPSSYVPPGSVIGGVVSWSPEVGPDAKGTVYGAEFPSSFASNDDEYGTLLLLPRLMLTLDPFGIPQNHLGYPDTLATSFKVSGTLEGRDLRTGGSFVFRDAVSGRGTARFEFFRESELGFTFPIVNFAFEPTDSAPVPEPTSILLLATGLGVIGRRAWNRVASL